MKRASLLLLLSLAAPLVGCELDPYCITCGDEPDAGSDTGSDADDDAADSGAEDALEDTGADTVPDVGIPDGCVSGELCNDNDDDCDGEVDEGYNLVADPAHCGGCNMVCAPPHAFPICSDGVCMMGDCDVGFLDLDGETDNGCEYRCLMSAENDAICDLRDEDCDGRVDEDVDLMNDPMNCGSCARFCSFPHATAGCGGGECMISACEDGFYDIDGSPENGCEYACVPSEDATEVCNARDDDCDGAIDEGDPGGGDACGEETGACSTGTTTCVEGSVICGGAVLPSTELCNGADDDCDGTTDEGDPEGGRLCGSAAGTCVQGRATCVAGSVECIGATGAIDEVCDGLDNDCDDLIDEGNPGGGAACGDDTGGCALGVRTCVGGAFACVGAVVPSVESCNLVDDDCDGTTDEGFDTARDPRHCGGCGMACALANAVPICSGGSCAVGACLSGFVDADDDAANGCEYECEFRGTEVCNGLDDDCDGDTDEALTAPAALCLSRGVCAGTAAACGGTEGWTCDYPATYEESGETRCDSIDNDCDGATDEAFPLVGDTCANGIGACRAVGIYECNAAGDGFVCTAPMAGTPEDEECDAADNDCDGRVDEVAPDDPATAWRDGITADAIDHVEVTRANGNPMLVMKYEASRPDASDADAGEVSTLACSRAGVLPWTNITWRDARDACCALNEDGSCPSSGETGWRLCPANDWESACEGPTDACAWSYASSCGTSQRRRCNGEEVDSDPARAGDQDAIATTGSFSGCYTRWSGGDVYDLSGNVKEWTATAVSSGVYQQRGGAYTNVESARTCEYDFVVAPRDFAFPNTGFRCCNY